MSAITSCYYIDTPSNQNKTTKVFQSLKTLKLAKRQNRKFTKVLYEFINFHLKVLQRG